MPWNESRLLESETDVVSDNLLQFHQKKTKLKVHQKKRPVLLSLMAGCWQTNYTFKRKQTQSLLPAMEPSAHTESINRLQSWHYLPTGLLLLVISRFSARELILFTTIQWDSICLFMTLSTEWDELILYQGTTHTFVGYSKHHLRVLEFPAVANGCWAHNEQSGNKRKGLESCRYYTRTHQNQTEITNGTSTHDIRFRNLSYMRRILDMICTKINQSVDHSMNQSSASSQWRIGKIDRHHILLL